MDITATLPAEWISHIISLTTPRDACRLAVVCPFFKSLADSDSVWEKFLPSDYKDIISNSASSSSLITSLSKKDLYFHLRSNPIIINNGHNPIIINSGKKAVFKVDLHDNKEKQKVMKTVSSLYGLDSISMDMKDKKLTVIGVTDPVTVVLKLRKLYYTEIVSVGPAKEPEKKEEEPETAEPKKDDK